MFGGSRRRQPPAQPLTRETANPSAATAAAAVFMSRRDSNSSLSSAAAAAALRARPMTPTNVAEVQSKRASRRSPSVSSLTGSVRGRRELTRSPSVGSMMERTFRTPSPGRSPAPREHVPPVPSMPSVDQIMASHQTNRQTKGSRGPALQTQPFKTASQKLKDGGQPSWFGGATARDANPRTSDAAIHSAAYVPEPRPGSVSPSINFSYPRARALSPSPSVDEHTLVYDPNSRRMVTREATVGHSQSVEEVSEKPKRKKKTASLDRTGSHLTKGTVGGRTIAPVLENQAAQSRTSQLESEEATGQKSMSAPAMVAEAAVNLPEVTPEKKKKKKKKKNKDRNKQQSSVPQTGAMDEEEQTTEKPALVTKASVVEEEPENEGVEEPKSKQGYSAMASAAAVSSNTVSHAKAQTPDSKPKKNVRQIRIQSESPARSAHFGASPGDQLAVKHEPPAGSLSPRKSALKLAANARGVSPSDDGSEASGSQRFSSQENGEPALARKKSARVSWDDRNTVVVGEAAQPQETDSPMIPSPQTKKPWHSVVSKFGKKESVTLAEDETMTPRPALPQFGSVREKKVKEPEERPLVRPSERTFTAENGPATTGVRQTTDAMIGGAISQDLASKNAANISKYREPLPAVLPSIEDKTDPNGTVESSDDDFDTDVTTEAEDGAEPTTATQFEKVVAVGPITPTKNTRTQRNADEVVPTISVSQPSPRATDSPDTSPPGSFPNDQVGSENKISSDDESEMSTPTQAADPAVVGVVMADIAEEDEEPENDRFSDAYEDLEEVDGDGFLSLDAVVDSPTAKKVPKKNGEEKPVATTTIPPQDEPTQPAMASPEEKDMQVPDDWENAKAYWKSLSYEKRRQLEIEALSETGEEASTLKKAENTTLIVKAPALSTERSYQIKPGTKWSGQDNDSNEDSEPEVVQPAKRASLVSTRAETTADAPDPKMRSSMRQSLRAGPAAAAPDMGLERPGGMRRSMRDGPVTKTPAVRQRTAEAPVTRSGSAAVPSMRQSLRASRSNGDALRPTLSSSGRPTSYHHPPTKGLSKNHKRNMSSDDLASSTVIKPTLRRRGSDDSESSFKRKRSGSASSDAHQFRTSMRPSLREPSSPSDPARRFSLRSLSPPGFRRNSFSSLPPEARSSMTGSPGRMRQSLRDRPTSPSSRLKIGSFKKPPGLGGKKSKKGSRFADSSDEEDDGPSLFRSRFADSSDDEEPAPLPKSRGLPKSLRNGNEPTSSTPSRMVASPELPGDDGGLTQPKRGSLPDGQSSIRRSRSGRGTLEPLPQNDMPRPAASRRGSLMSILRRKKDTSDKISKDVGESVARKDTVLERSPEELAQLRSNSFHKRGPSWPLPDEGGPDTANSRPSEPSRPSTAGGVAPSKMSSFLRRRSTSQGMVGLGHAEVDVNEAVPPIPAEFAQTGSQQPQQTKKKKFGALRKMFGIHD
ncbi:hypothetical protein C2857_003737 [Epichloe festucae Fl1]|uniref:Uncharacterized protein n=1 Tax=Epichloe festucae (strain Fl1) TaxID=877507 RepID=A0A7U3Q222_EPIFF|nr:hypothetical protein C2857_003737 [Epichloe festucae Fl1]